MKSFRRLLSLNSSAVGSRAGFTLVEILLVVAILGILATVAVVRLGGQTKRASIAACRTSIQAIQTAADTYEVDNGIYPATLQALVTKGTENNWNGPYLRNGVPKDQWGAEFQYSTRENGFEIRSAGPDGQMGTADDLTN